MVRRQEDTRWVLCPVCGNKTRTKVFADTVLVNFPLFCPKCRQECVIDAKALKITVRETHHIA